MSTSDFKGVKGEEGRKEGFVPLGGRPEDARAGGFEPCVNCVDTMREGGGEDTESTPTARAESIVDEARKKAEHIEREAFEKGFAQGEKAGKEMMERSLETTLESLKSALSSLEELSVNLRAQMEEEVARLSLAVARKIIQREVSEDPGLVRNVVQGVLEKGQLRGDVLIRVNPMDIETMKEIAPELKKDLEGVKGFEIEPDESVEKGGAVVECESGELDVRLERQLMEIERAFEKILKEEAST